MSTIKAEDFKNRVSISIGDTVLVHDKKGFEIVDIKVILDLEGKPDVLFLVSWFNEDAKGTDLIHSNKIATLLV